MKVLANHEKENKDQCVEPCLAQHRHFTPLFFLVDDLRGTEAEGAIKQLLPWCLTATKWKWTYSKVCGYVRSHLAITLVRTTSLCLQGTPDPTAPHATWD
jgi:hypothetical protein